MPENRTDSYAGSGTFVAERVGTVLDRAGDLLKAERFESIVERVAVSGHWGLLALAVLGFLTEIMGVGSYGASAVFWAIGWLIALPLLQYIAVQFMGVTRSMVISNTTRLGSQVFLRCYALVALIAAIVALAGALILGIGEGSFREFLSGLAVTALWLATAWLALNPSLLGIRVDSRLNAGEEAIGVLSFFVKSGVRLVPVFYGVVMVVGALLALVTLVQVIGASGSEVKGLLGDAQSFAAVVISAALAPFLAYIGFVFYSLVIDLMRSILAIPGQLGGGGGNRSGGGRSGGGSRSGGSSRSGSGTRSRSRSRSSSRSSSSRSSTGSTGGGSST